MSHYHAECRCGYRSEEVQDRVAAEVHGDVHEAKQVARPYRHEIRINEVQR